MATTATVAVRDQTNLAGLGHHYYLVDGNGQHHGYAASLATAKRQLRTCPATTVALPVRATQYTTWPFTIAGTPSQWQALAAANKGAGITYSTTRSAGGHGHTVLLHAATVWGLQRAAAMLAQHGITVPATHPHPGTWPRVTP